MNKPIEPAPIPTQTAPAPINKIDALRVAVEEAIQVFCESIPQKFTAQVAVTADVSVTAGDEETDTRSTFLLRFKKRNDEFWVWFVTADGNYVPAQKAPVRVLLEVVKNLPALREAIDQAVRAADERIDEALSEAETFVHRAALEAAKASWESPPSTSTTPVVEVLRRRSGGGGGGRPPADR